jgi:hypothetical protein
LARASPHHTPHAAEITTQAISALAHHGMSPHHPRDGGVLPVVTAPALPERAVTGQSSGVLVADLDRLFGPILTEVTPFSRADRHA